MQTHTSFLFKVISYLSGSNLTRKFKNFEISLSRRKRISKNVSLSGDTIRRIFYWVFACGSSRDFCPSYFLFNLTSHCLNHSVTFACFIKSRFMKINVQSGVYLPGFLPRETAEHHRGCILHLVREALNQANIAATDIDVICFTKGWNQILLVTFLLALM